MSFLEIIGNFSLGSFSESSRVIKESEVNFLHNKDLDVGNSKLVPEGTKKYFREAIEKKERERFMDGILHARDGGKIRKVPAYDWGWGNNFCSYTGHEFFDTKYLKRYAKEPLSQEYLTYIFIRRKVLYFPGAGDRFYRPATIIDDWIGYAMGAYRHRRQNNRSLIDELVDIEQSDDDVLALLYSIKEAYRGVETLKDVEKVTMKFREELNKKMSTYCTPKENKLLHEFTTALSTVDSFQRWYIRYYYNPNIFWRIRRAMTSI
jgi:hypothetical protein